jgi:hypothetical protein
MIIWVCIVIQMLKHIPTHFVMTMREITKMLSSDSSILSMEQGGDMNRTQIGLNAPHKKYSRTQGGENY